MNALVLGYGRSGRAAEALLKRRGGADAGVDIVEQAGLVVVSPGIRVVSELQLGCEELKRRGVKMVAVTGSKGKSSVVKLIADALTRAGRRAVPCGNYGLPVCEVAARVDADLPEWAVVEVSSFQMETTNLAPDTFEAAAILNLQDDHLDRHGSREVYHALKRRLLSAARTAFDCAAPAADAVLEGSYFDNSVLRVNGAIADAVMRRVGLDEPTRRAAFLGFTPLPHRMNEVGVVDGVRYIDDSKATSIAALVAGVRMAPPPVRLIAGGLPKGDDPKDALDALTARVKKCYTIGQCAEVFASAWGGAVDCEVCGTLERAVRAARREAARGETVLLSPGTASFDQFHSFGERGDVFAGLVKKEKDKR